MPSSTLQPLQLYNKYAQWGELLKQSPVLLVPSLSDKRTTVRSLFSNCQSHIFYLNSPSFRELHSTFYLQMNSVWYRRWMKLKINGLFKVDSTLAVLTFIMDVRFNCLDPSFEIANYAMYGKKRSLFT